MVIIRLGSVFTWIFSIIMCIVMTITSYLCAIFAQIDLYSWPNGFQSDAKIPSDEPKSRHVTGARDSARSSGVGDVVPGQISPNMEMYSCLYCMGFLCRQKLGKLSAYNYCWCLQEIFLLFLQKVYTQAEDKEYDFRTLFFNQH